MQNKLIKLIKKRYSSQLAQNKVVDKILKIRKLYHYTAIKFNMSYLIKEQKKKLKQRDKGIKPIFKNKRTGQKCNIYIAVKIFNNIPNSIKSYLKKKRITLVLKLIKDWLTNNQIK